MQDTRRAGAGGGLGPGPAVRHGPGLAIARSGAGTVTMCPSCGVPTLTLQCTSLRFGPAALRELQGLLAFAQRRLDGDDAATVPRAPASTDATPMH